MGKNKKRGNKRAVLNTSPKLDDGAKKKTLAEPAKTDAAQTETPTATPVEPPPVETPVAEDEATPIGKKEKTLVTEEPKASDKTTPAGEKETPAVDKKEKTPTAGKTEKTTPTDEPEKTPVVEKEPAKPAANKQRTPSTDKKEKAAVADKSEKTTVVDKKEQTPADDKEQTPAVDKKERTPSGNKPKKTPAADKPTKTPTTVKKEKEPVVPLSRELGSRHLLKHTWVMWIHKAQGQKDWLACLKDVAKMECVEDFFAIYQNIRSVSSIPYVADISVFKEGIKPTWESEMNKSGGKFVCQIERSRDGSAAVDGMWLELLLAMIGEQFEEAAEQVCGAVVSVRKAAKPYKIGLWTRDASLGRAGLEPLGKMMKEAMGRSAAGPVPRIGYEPHESSKIKTHSQMPADFYV